MCLSVPQRQRLADSMATLPVVRRAAQQYRLSADAYAGALVAQQRLSTDAALQASAWKATARKRGLLNLLLVAGLGGLGYFTLSH